FAARLATTDATAEDADRIGVVPFAMRRPEDDRPASRPADGAPVVASFGVVNPVKQTALIVEAFALLVPTRPSLRLAVVGPASSSDLDDLAALVDRRGIADSVTITGEVSDSDYARWMARATVAAQLRARS